MSGAVMARGLLAGLSLAGATLAAAPAQATITVATTGFLGEFTCPQASGTDCVLTAANRTSRVVVGGAVGSLSSASVLPSGATLSANVTYGNDMLPTIRAGTFSGLQSRDATSVLALRAYTWTGDAINLALSGSMHFFKGTADVPGETFDRSYLGLSLFMLPASVFTGYTASSRAIDFIIDPALNPQGCGAGVTAFNFVSSTGLNPGEHSLPVDLSSACTGGSIRINPGDQFVIGVGMQAIANRGGWLDATHTFNLNYDLANTTFVSNGAPVGASYLSANLAGVPEPATWGLMILGFGVIGGAMRSRRRERVFAR